MQVVQSIARSVRRTRRFELEVGIGIGRVGALAGRAINERPLDGGDLLLDEAHERIELGASLRPGRADGAQRLERGH